MYYLLVIAKYIVITVLTGNVRGIIRHGLKVLIIPVPTPDHGWAIHATQKEEKRHHNYYQNDEGNESHLSQFHGQLHITEKVGVWH